jgi:hypothetical protein
MGQLFSNLTKSGIQQPNGQTTFQDSPAATAQALAAASAATAQPGTSSIVGAGGGAPQIPLDGQPDTNRVIDSAPPVAPQPKVVQPTFAQATSGGTDPFSSTLTSKGKVLSGLLVAMQGAARGAAASVPTNPHISPGLGPAMEAGFETIPALKSQQNTLTLQELEQQKEKAQIAALPLQAQTELALKRAQTSWYNQRGEAVGEHNLKAGDTLVDKDGNVIRQGASPQDIAAARQAGKDAGTVAAVRSAGGTPEQVLAALGVKASKQNTSLAQMYLDKNGGDPGLAIKNMNADKVSFHAGLPAARKSGGGASTPNALPLAAAQSKTPKTLDMATAQQYLQKAGGDKNKARQLAAADGYSF